MSKYVSNKAMFEAFKWTGGYSQTEDPIWAVKAISDKRLRLVNSGTPNVKLAIRNYPEDRIEYASPGYYICLIEGRIYAFPPTTFEKKYVQVVE